MNARCNVVQLRFNSFIYLQNAHNRHPISSTREIFDISFFSWKPVHGANMGPTWFLSAPVGSHVGPMNLAIRVYGMPPVTLRNTINHVSCSIYTTYLIGIGFGYLNSVWPRCEFSVNVLRSFCETREPQDARHCMLEWRLNPMPRGSSHDTDRRVRKRYIECAGVYAHG